MGNQKDARLNRLKFEIIDYVERHPGCTANQIVAGLAIDRGLNNHGLTPRKVGFLIPTTFLRLSNGVSRLPLLSRELSHYWTS